MYLLDNDNQLVDSEFSLDIFEGSQCLVIESSGGARPRRGTNRRNPDYNRLIEILLSRLSGCSIKLTKIVLDSSRVADLDTKDRVAELDQPYPIDLATVNIPKIRKMIARTIAMMHRAPDASSRGNGQKRIRICLDHPVDPARLVGYLPDNTPTDIPNWFPPRVYETERERLRKARLGQGRFREALLNLYSQKCPITGISNPDLLIASHIKPWSVSTNAERLDTDNGILISVLIDRLFDRGLITFKDDGSILTSPLLSASDQEWCRIHEVQPLPLSKERRNYMAYHRAFVFKSNGMLL